VKVFYDTTYCATDVAWETTRKADVVAQALQSGAVTGIELVSPAAMTLDELQETISLEYLKALQTGVPQRLAQSNSIGWDERLLAAVSASNGGVRDAALTALRTGENSGSLSSGLHHARATSGSGYCTVNGLIVAARAAHNAGAARIMILDLDAHCGGGTASSISDIPGCEQLDISVNFFDSYTPQTNTKLVTADGRDYLAVVERELNAVQAPSGIDLVLYNAGMDPHENAGGVRGITTSVIHERERMVFEWAASQGVPVAWVLAGGYTVGMQMKELAELHLLTARVATEPRKW
jgi:acetoin utilization deacetylase AcuC-like enzyme